MEKRKILHIPTSLYSKNRKVITLGVTLLNKPGALMSILTFLSQRNINILSIMSSAVGAEEKETTLSMVVDVTELADEIVDSVIEDMRKSQYVTDLRVSTTSINGFAADQYHTEYRLFNLRVIMMSEVTMYGFFKYFYEKFQNVAGAFFYHIGFGSGREVAALHKGIFNNDIETCLRFLPYQARAFGYASELQIKKIDRNIFEFKFQNLMECNVVRKIMNGKTSNWVRGIAAGYMTELLGMEYSAEEIECINYGGGSCTILARPRL